MEESFLKRQGPAFWTGVFGVVLLLLAWGLPVGYADRPAPDPVFGDSKLPLTWGNVTIWVLRAATVVAAVSLLARQLRSSSAIAAVVGLAGVAAAVDAVWVLREFQDSTLGGRPLEYITSGGLWFAIGGGVALLIAAFALARTARRRV